MVLGASAAACAIAGEIGPSAISFVASAVGLETCSRAKEEELIVVPEMRCLMSAVILAAADVVAILPLRMRGIKCKADATLSAVAFGCPSSSSCLGISGKACC